MRYQKVKNGSEKSWKYLNQYFWRIFSMPIARALTKTSIRPEFIVLLSFLFSIVSAFFFASPLENGAFWGTVFFIIYWLLDNVDGDLARLKGQTSHLGSFLDSLSGKLSTIIIYFSICIHCSRNHDPIKVWIMGYAMISAFYIFGMMGKTATQLKNKMRPKTKSKEPAYIDRNLIRTIVHELTEGHNILYYALILGGLLNQLYLILIVSVIYAWIFTPYSIYRNFKEVKSLEHY